MSGFPTTLLLREILYILVIGRGEIRLAPRNDTVKIPTSHTSRVERLVYYDALEEQAMHFKRSSLITTFFCSQKIRRNSSSVLTVCLELGKCPSLCLKRPLSCRWSSSQGLATPRSCTSRCAPSWSTCGRESRTSRLLVVSVHTGP